MQTNLSYNQIKDYFDYLRSCLKTQPTAINDLYKLPEDFSKQNIFRNFSQASLQKISDHIGFYLGLLKSVKVTLLEEQSGYRWVSSEKEVLHSDDKGSPVSGFYKTVGLDHNEIVLVKKATYTIDHMLAILAHECTHNYLFHHKIKADDESENEILTDLATTYLGLGHLLINGYKPITKIDDILNYILGNSYTKTKISLGYITPNTIRRAIILATEFRKWKRSDVIACFSSIVDKVIVFFELNISGNEAITEIKMERNILENRINEANNLKREINEITGMYNSIYEKINIIQTDLPTLSIRPNDGHVLVEVVNKIFTGEILYEIKSASEKVDNLITSCEINEDVSELNIQIHNLKNIVTKWYEVLGKYKIKE